MASRRRGFTLIELLVVIAIIAILAAILFPVFAQARQAARGASSQSNIKQISLGILMYTQDYDETFPLDASWGYGPITIGGNPYTQWSWDILPYIKNVQIFQDPLGVPQTRQPHSVWDVMFPQYGYNYTALSPYKGAFGTTPWIRTPNSMAAVSRPADLVMIAGKFSFTEIGALYWYGPGTMTTLAGAEPPDCSTSTAWCFAGWGISSNYTDLLKTDEKGAFTGGVTLRKAKNANVALVDGHAKFMQAGSLAVGTNWRQNIPEDQIVVTDKTRYMWWPSETGP